LSFATGHTVINLCSALESVSAFVYVCVINYRNVLIAWFFVRRQTLLALAQWLLLFFKSFSRNAIAAKLRPLSSFVYSADNPLVGDVKTLR
jgi:hypothetical protein